MAIHAGVIELTEPPAGGRPEAAVSRAALWANVAEGIEAFADGAGPAGEGEGEACAARVGTWLQGRAHLAEGDSIDRHLVEALIEAAAAHLVYAGRDPGRVDAARHRFEDRAFGHLAPAAASPAPR